ncbi:unnamed protein product, partial [Ixodes persulcatus]
LNVRGLNERRRQRQLYRLVVEQDLDIVAVQETKVESEDRTEFMVRPFTTLYNVCVSHAVGTSAGCLLLVRQSLGATVQAVTTCDSGRFVVCDLLFSSFEWRIICVYAPTRVEERRAFFDLIQQYCNCERLLIFLGDFNCVCSSRDKTSTTPYSDASTVSLSRVISENGLDDVGECLRKGRDVLFTHFQGASHARLDRAYVSLELLPFCFEYRVRPVSFSDHCLVSCCLRSEKENRKCFSWELWKLNSKLLVDDVFKASVQASLQEVENWKTSEYGAKWDLFKQRIKILALERASAIKNEESRNETVLRNSLQILIKEEGKTPGYFKDDICSLKAKLELIDKERYRGALVRARAGKVIAGETPTKRALGLEKRNARRNDIAEIDCGGTVSSDQSDIERAFYEYRQ